MEIFNKEVWQEFFRLKKEELKIMIAAAGINFLKFLLVCACCIGGIAALIGICMGIGWVHLTFFGFVWVFATAKTLTGVMAMNGLVDLLVIFVGGALLFEFFSWLHENWCEAVYNIDIKKRRTEKSEELEKTLYEIETKIKNSSRKRALEKQKKSGKKGKKA